jgi:hypothetical protein
MNNANVERNGEIVTALDAVLGWYRERGVYEKYRAEFCGLALKHLSYAFSRVLRQDPGHAVIDKLVNYLETNFPDYKKNKYYSTMTKQQKVILALVMSGKTRVAAGIFKLNDRLHGR